MIKYIYLFILFIFIYKSSSFDFNLDLYSDSDSELVECGGPINKNDTSIYPPCKSFVSLGNRIRKINEFSNDYNLNINIIVNQNHIEINENEYLGTINSFKQIEIKVINQNGQQTNDMVSIKSTLSIFINISSNYHSSNIKLYNLKFIDFNKYSVVVSKNYNLYFENITFENSQLMLASESANSGVYFTNCEINNIKETFPSLSIQNIKSVIINNININKNNFSGISLNNVQYLIINNIKFNNNKVNSGALISVDQFKNISITNIIIENNSIQSVLSINSQNQDKITLYLIVNNLQIKNNIFGQGTSNEIYLFKLYSYYNILNSYFNNIHIDINNQTLNSIISYPNNFANIYINNITSTNQNSFINIINIFHSQISILNSLIPSKEVFIKGENNNITIDSASVYNYDESIIKESCNIINNQFVDNCGNINSTNDKFNKNKIIAIIIPVVLFSTISIIGAALLIVHLKKKNNQKKQLSKNTKNNFINDIIGEGCGTTDTEIANPYVPTFLDDIDDINASTE